MRERARTLLDWYDVHAREMPWRVGPAGRKGGLRPDPYRVWLSEIMLQQTTVAAVREYFQAFTSRWPTLRDLAEAQDADVMAAWAGLGYYARARNLLKCARTVVEHHGGKFPSTREGLQTLPGIGPYTSAAIAAIAFDRVETVVDGNVERVMARLHDVHDPLPDAKRHLAELARALTPAERPGDYAQAVMDLGATICTPRNPGCGICPWRDPCAARAAGTAAQLPRKRAKPAKPVRRGILYIARLGDGAWILERRADKGMLGGMLGWPGTRWDSRAAEHVVEPAPPFDAAWCDVPGEVRHTFTHYHLVLALKSAWVDRVPDGYNVIPAHELRPSDLPTLMRKAFDLVRNAQDTRLQR